MMNYTVDTPERGTADDMVNLLTTSACTKCPTRRHRTSTMPPKPAKPAPLGDKKMIHRTRRQATQNHRRSAPQTPSMLRTTQYCVHRRPTPELHTPAGAGLWHTYICHPASCTASHRATCCHISVWHCVWAPGARGLTGMPLVTTWRCHTAEPSSSTHTPQSALLAPPIPPTTVNPSAVHACPPPPPRSCCTTQAAPTLPPPYHSHTPPAAPHRLPPPGRWRFTMPMM